MPSILSIPSLESSLFDFGIDITNPGLHFMDDPYALADYDYLQTTFSDEFRAFLSDIGAIYDAEDEDCDDFARAAAWFAGFKHRHTPGRPPGTAIAFGEFHYKASFGMHAINLAVVRHNGKLEPFFYEPQKQQQTFVSRDERATCNFLRF